MNENTVIPLELDDDTIIHLEVLDMGGERDVAFENISFGNVKKQIQRLSTEILESVKSIKPQKASIEFGIGFTLKSGELTSLIVSGEGNSSIKITLEWEASKENK